MAHDLILKPWYSKNSAPYKSNSLVTSDYCKYGGSIVFTLIILQQMP